MTPRSSWNQGMVTYLRSTPFRAQVITLSALPPSEEDGSYPCYALSELWESTLSVPSPFRRTEQLFVSFGNRAKGHPVTKQRLSKWIVDAVMLAYSSLGLQCPIGVRAHSTRGIASSWAWSSGVSITEICAAAGWATPSTLARFSGHTGLTGQSPLCLDELVCIRCGNNPVRDFLTAMRSGSLIGTLHTPVLNWVRSHMERSPRPSMTSMSLARFSLEYTTHFPMGINAYGGIYSRSSTLARRDWIEFPYASSSRRSTSGVSTGNVLGYSRNLGSLRYGTSTAYFAVPDSCTTQSSLQSK